MKNKTEIWNSFIGKKILFIYTNNEAVGTLVVTGCDPDIGICLNLPNEIEPILIILGPSAPNYGNSTPKVDRQMRAILDMAFDMLRSGYFSEVIFDSEVNRICGEEDDYYNDISCPYSM